MSWLASFWVVLSKELREGMRDRKALVTALFFPVLGPILVIVMLFLVSDSSRQADEKGVEIPVAGRANAPNLVALLEQGARVVEAPADPVEAVRRGDVPVVIVIPPDFGEKLRAGQPAPVKLILDESRHQARPAAATAERLLAAWSHQVVGPAAHRPGHPPRGGRAPGRGTGGRLHPGEPRRDAARHHPLLPRDGDVHRRDAHRHRRHRRGAGTAIPRAPLRGARSPAPRWCSPRSPPPPSSAWPPSPRP